MNSSRSTQYQRKTALGVDTEIRMKIGVHTENIGKKNGFDNVEKRTPIMCILNKSSAYITISNKSQLFQYPRDKYIRASDSTHFLRRIMKKIQNINFESIQTQLKSDSSDLHCASKTGGTVKTDNTGESDKLSKRKRKPKAKKRGRKPKKQAPFKDYHYHYDFNPSLLLKLGKIIDPKVSVRSYELSLKILFFVACKSPKSGWECIKGVSLPRNYLKALGYGSTTIKNVFDLLTDNRLLIITREADRQATGDDGKQGRCREFSIPDIYRVNLKLPDKMNLFKRMEEIPEPVKEPKPEIIEEPQIIEPMKPEPETNTEDLKKIETIIKKYNTPFYRNRIKEIGLDPFQDCKCSECENELPAYMFSISKNNKLNTKCRVCWEIEPVSGGDNAEAERVMGETMKLFKRETPTQRSIRRLNMKNDPPFQNKSLPSQTMANL